VLAIRNSTDLERQHYVRANLLAGYNFVSPALRSAIEETAGEMGRL